MHPPFNLHLSTQTPQIIASSAPQQQVIPSNHLQGYSSNSLLQIQPQLATTIDPRIPNLMIAPNQPFPFQNGTPLLGPRAPVPHQGQQFLSEFLRPQNLNSTATNQNYYCRPNDQPFAVNSLNLAPMSMRSQFIPVKTPNYTTHFVPQSQVSSMGTPPPPPPQNADYIPREQLGPGPIYPPLQHHAQNFLPIFIDPQVNDADTEKLIDSIKDTEKLMSLETESAETKDTLVLQKLLRGPRYFDPLESCGEVCGKCGNEDHKTTDCNMQKRKKPCFICGRFDHSGKHWKKKKGGFNCNLSHLLNVCLEPKADENYRICLRCGDSGHSMFSCNNDYSPDDLKQIKCYICNEFGHLCCAEYVDEGPRQVSCYKCGELGHLGPGCPNGHGHSIDSEAASLCATCGEKGHIVINCQKNDKEDEDDDDDDECIIADLATTVETFSKDKEDQLGNELCKSLLKQKDATQVSSSSASVLVQV